MVHSLSEQVGGLAAFQPMPSKVMIDAPGGVEGKKSLRSMRTMVALPTCGRALVTMEWPRQKPVAQGWV
jgi:hypothetical protein